MAVTSKAAPAVLAGRVLFADSRAPVAGAQLLIRDVARGELEETSETRITCHAEGCFRLDLPERTVVAIEISAKGCIPRRLPYVAVSPDLEILIVRGSRLVVELREARPAEPSVLDVVADASCQLVRRGDNRRFRCIETATTDAAGEATFMLLGRQVHLVIEKVGRLAFSEIYELDEGQERLRVVLPRLEELRGRVIDKRSRLPVAGAMLSESHRPAFQIETDSDGLYHIPHECRGPDLWVVQKSGYSSVFLKADGQPNAMLPDVELEGLAVITGSCAGFEGEVRVTARSEKAYYVHQRWRRSGSTDEGGRVRFEDAPPHEDILVHAADRKGRFGFARAPAAQPGQTTDFGVLRPGEPAMLHGTLAGFAPDKPILLRVEVERESVPVEDRTLVVRGSEYEMKGLAAGKCTFWALQGDVRSRRERFELMDGSRTRFDFDLGPTVSGVVQDESGAGVPDVVVVASDAGGPVRGSEATRTDATGRFMLATAHPGVVQDVRVPFTSRDQIVVPREIKSVVPGGDPLRFVIQKGTLSIRGSVDAEVLKTLRPGQRLEVFGHDALGNRASATVGADGTFALTVREHGPHVIELFVLDQSGPELMLLPIPRVNALCDVVPGGRAIVFRAAPR